MFDNAGSNELDPRIFEMALEHAGMDTDRQAKQMHAVHIGDHLKKDGIAAAAAGWISIVIDPNAAQEGPLEKYPGVYIVHQLASILQLER